jgi:hypothetical protein
MYCNALGPYRLHFHSTPHEPTKLCPFSTYKTRPFLVVLHVSTTYMRVLRSSPIIDDPPIVCHLNDKTKTIPARHGSSNSSRDVSLMWTDKHKG